MIEYTRTNKEEQLLNFILLKMKNNKKQVEVSTGFSGDEIFEYKDSNISIAVTTERVSVISEELNYEICSPDSDGLYANLKEILLIELKELDPLVQLIDIIRNSVKEDLDN